jgi:uncharacterized oxidoreductase
MNISGNQILITGGATGIGLALAEAFLKAGNQVAVCGRRQDKLDEIRQILPGVKTIQADLATAEGRTLLISQALDELPKLNIIVNNAGMMQAVQLNEANPVQLEKWLRDEVEIDCLAPILIATQLLPHLERQASAAIVNVTTGLVFAPAATYPFYAAAKAGLRAFTQSLRFQLRASSVKVLEVLPPAVDTALNQSKDPKISPQQVAQETLRGLEKGMSEIKVGQSKILAILARLSPGLAYSMINGKG